MQLVWKCNYYYVCGLCKNYTNFGNLFSFAFTSFFLLLYVAKSLLNDVEVCIICLNDWVIPGFVVGCFLSTQMQQHGVSIANESRL